MTIVGRDSELLRAQKRAYQAAADLTSLPGPPIHNLMRTAGGAGINRMPIGTLMSELLKHGGLYTLTDDEMMAQRFNGLMMGLVENGTPSDMMADMQSAMQAAKSVPTFFFYHLVDKPYPLHSQLVSYLSYPARHLRSPVNGAPAPCPTDSTVLESAPPFGPTGKVYNQCNTPSPTVPVAATFIGQFIDHDLTLNAMNLLDAQAGSDVRDQASPLIDLDNVYGPRLDDAQTGTRLVPMQHGMFCLRPIPGTKGFDVCRTWDKTTCTHKALIGDKRNDENQLILQVHILAMRLHNHFMAQTRHFHAAKRETILHWQAMVATYYLPLIARPEAIDAVKARLLNAPQTLCHRPGLTACGGTALGMPHEFAIGFRFGHSQLRSEYFLAEDRPPVRLFDPLAAMLTGGDLQGGKHLTPAHLIDWPYFVSIATPQTHSNLIDTQVNEVVFSLPESTIPDDIKLVNNLPLRNLIRSNSVGLCAGEDLARCYHTCYPDLAEPLTPIEVEPAAEYQDLFKLVQDSHCDPEKIKFLTPLWYYLLREAEVDRRNDPDSGRLGMVGSLLIAEVILSGIYYARLSTTSTHAHHAMCRSERREESEACSIFEDPAWADTFGKWTADDAPLLTFLDLAEMIEASGVVPPECPPETISEQS